MARLKGSNITFTIDGDDVTLDATSVVLDSEEQDGDAPTFAEVNDGGAYTFFFNITAYQNSDAASLHTLLWTNGGDEVPFVFAPAGNATPSATAPHYKGTVRIPGGAATVGGEAGTSGWTFEKRFDVVGVVERDVTV